MNFIEMCIKLQNFKITIQKYIRRVVMKHDVVQYLLKNFFLLHFSTHFCRSRVLV